MTSFDTYLPAILEQAEREAQRDGASTFEVHHLLLAISAVGEGTTTTALESAGLNYQAIQEMFQREFEHSLSTAGVSLASADLPKPTPGPGRPKVGTSVKLALERSLAAVTRKKDLHPAHLLLGVVQAPVGTVPRALALAGISQAELLAGIEQVLADQK
ncbi:Clp protease N-terminal domain-containing protein [Phytoactinopolyspora limicola]|uniref:Clp protease N-terminal domain-containing protein n=1 Tax=Phytoactinopolyspora limicola TaxID=2715536 RepID=UPI001409F2C1|nr:Clp protease N-terminal domain-containing protein [Phytoactinopolyspora limicola]